MTGLPIRREIEQKDDVEQKEAGVFSERPLSVLFVGGSQGAKVFNEALPEFVEKHGDKLNKFRIIHQTGLKNYESVLKAYKKKKIESFSVEVLAYLDPIKDYYDQADLVVCRSGASTVVELSVMGKPALFVPFPKASDDHQKSNAMSLVSRGAALLLEEKNFSSDTLVEILLSLKENPDSLVDLKQASQSIFPLGAREKVAKIVMGFRLE
jgi:UDP-N-acetylglucosamine--N-acetylmuramyl-(pentapeptide) pyrophosphoryl-undecaprenol N-acetylglucosamine transferase